MRQRSYVEILGTLRSEDGNGRESVAEKVNSRSFNLHRKVYSKMIVKSIFRCQKNINLRKNCY